MLQGADTVAHLVHDPLHLNFKVCQGVQYILVGLAAGCLGIDLGLLDDLITAYLCGFHDRIAFQQSLRFSRAPT